MRVRTKERFWADCRFVRMWEFCKFLVFRRLLKSWLIFFSSAHFISKSSNFHNRLDPHFSSISWLQQFSSKQDWRAKERSNDQISDEIKKWRYRELREVREESHVSACSYVLESMKLLMQIGSSFHEILGWSFGRKFLWLSSAIVSLPRITSRVRPSSRYKLFRTDQNDSGKEEPCLTLVRDLSGESYA